MASGLRGSETDGAGIHKCCGVTRERAEVDIRICDQLDADSVQLQDDFLFAVVKNHLVTSHPDGLSGSQASLPSS